MTSATHKTIDFYHQSDQKYKIINRLLYYDLSHYTQCITIILIGIIVLFPS